MKLPQPVEIQVIKGTTPASLSTSWFYNFHQEVPIKVWEGTERKGRWCVHDCWILWLVDHETCRRFINWRLSAIDHRINTVWIGKRVWLRTYPLTVVFCRCKSCARIEEGVCFLEQNARILRSGLVESYNIWVPRFIISSDDIACLWDLFRPLLLDAVCCRACLVLFGWGLPSIWFSIWISPLLSGDEANDPDSWMPINLETRSCTFDLITFCLNFQLYRSYARLVKVNMLDQGGGNRKQYSGRLQKLFQD